MIDKMIFGSGARQMNEWITEMGFDMEVDWANELFLDLED